MSVQSQMFDDKGGRESCVHRGLSYQRDLVLRPGVLKTGCTLEPPKNIKKKKKLPSSYPLDSGLMIWMELRSSPFQKLLRLTAISQTIGSVTPKPGFKLKHPEPQFSQCQAGIMVVFTCGGHLPHSLLCTGICPPISLSLSRSFLFFF